MILPPPAVQLCNRSPLSALVTSKLISVVEDDFNNYPANGEKEQAGAATISNLKNVMKSLYLVLGPIILGLIKNQLTVVYNSLYSSVPNVAIVNFATLFVVLMIRY